GVRGPARCRSRDAKHGCSFLRLRPAPTRGPTRRTKGARSGEGGWMSHLRVVPRGAAIGPAERSKEAWMREGCGDGSTPSIRGWPDERKRKPRRRARARRGPPWLNLITPSRGDEGPSCLELSPRGCDLSTGFQIFLIPGSFINRMRVDLP